jgi:hypothetical protein
MSSQPAAAKMPAFLLGKLSSTCAAAVAGASQFVRSVSDRGGTRRHTADAEH